MEAYNSYQKVLKSESNLLDGCSTDSMYKYFLLKSDFEGTLFNHSRSIDIIKNNLMPLTEDDSSKSKHANFLLIKAYFEGNRRFAAYYSLLDICKDPSYDLKDRICAHLMLARLHSKLSLSKTSQEYVSSARDLVSRNYEQLEGEALLYELKCAYEESVAFHFSIHQSKAYMNCKNLVKKSLKIIESEYKEDYYQLIFDSMKLIYNHIGGIQTKFYEETIARLKALSDHNWDLLVPKQFNDYFHDHRDLLKLRSFLDHR